MIDKEQLLKEWDFSSIPSPCYVLHESMLSANMGVIDKVRKATKAHISVALKANAMWSIFPVLKKHSDGATASSLAEARLVYEEFGEKSHTYAPVYTANEIDEILSLSSHITFNSLSQYRRYAGKAHAAHVSCGLRVNPEYSTVETDLYNPCNRGSRLGILSEDLQELPAGIEGRQMSCIVPILQASKGCISMPCVSHARMICDRLWPQWRNGSANSFLG